MSELPAAPSPARVHREVTSFVRRSSRMTPSQQRALREQQHRLVPVERGRSQMSVAPGPPLDLAATFGRTAPLLVEIGPGTGESLVPMATARPDADVLAFEVYDASIANVLARLHAAGLDNVRMVEADAVTGLQHLLTPASVAELWLFFPDPWPKAKHHKRRLVDDAFADLAVSRIASGGLWRLATDWDDYAAQMTTVLDARPELTRLSDDERGALPPRPTTRFERRAWADGRSVTELAYRRG